MSPGEEGEKQAGRRMDSPTGCLNKRSGLRAQPWRGRALYRACFPGCDLRIRFGVFSLFHRAGIVNGSVHEEAMGG